MYDFGPRQTPHGGYRVAYRADAANKCPGCGEDQWLIGRMTAECAFCATALPLVAGGTLGSSSIRYRSDVHPLAA